MIKPDLFKNTALVEIKNLKAIEYSMNTYSKKIGITYSRLYYKFTLNNTLLLYFKGCRDYFNNKL